MFISLARGLAQRAFPYNTTSRRGGSGWTHICAKPKQTTSALLRTSPLPSRTSTTSMLQRDVVQTVSASGSRSTPPSGSGHDSSSISPDLSETVTRPSGRTKARQPRAAHSQCGSARIPLGPSHPHAPHLASMTAWCCDDLTLTSLAPNGAKLLSRRAVVAACCSPRLPLLVASHDSSSPAAKPRPLLALHVRCHLARADC